MLGIRVYPAQRPLGARRAWELFIPFSVITRGLCFQLDGLPKAKGEGAFKATPVLCKATRFGLWILMSRVHIQWGKSIQVHRNKARFPRNTSAFIPLTAEKWNTLRGLIYFVEIFLFRPMEIYIFVVFLSAGKMGQLPCSCWSDSPCPESPGKSRQRPSPTIGQLRGCGALQTQSRIGMGVGERRMMSKILK